MEPTPKDRILTVQQLKAIVDIQHLQSLITLEASNITFDENIIQIQNNGIILMVHPLLGIYNAEGKIIHHFSKIHTPYISVNSQYLDKSNPVIHETLNTFCEVGGVLVIKSPLGSGKTKLLCDLFENEFKNSKILCITCRVSLADDLHGKFKKYGFTKYNSVGIDCGDQPKLLIQFDSLRKLLKATNKGLSCLNYDVIIIDEIVSLLHHMMNENLRKDIAILYNELKQLITDSRHCVMLDGMITNDVLDIIDDFGKPVMKLFNDYAANPLTITFERSKKTIYKDIRESLAAGNKIVILSSSINQIDKIKNYLPDNVVYETPKGNREEGKLYAQVYHGQIGNEISEDLQNVNDSWQKLDILIYTSKVGCGVDFSAHHFDKLYAFISGHTAPMPMWCQMLRRVRHLSNPNIMCAVSHAGTDNLTYYINEMNLPPVGYTNENDGRIIRNPGLEKIKRYYNTVMHRTNTFGLPYFIQALSDQHYTIINKKILTPTKIKPLNKFDLYSDILSLPRTESFDELRQKEIRNETTTLENLAITREIIQRQFSEGYSLVRGDVKLLYHSSNVQACERLRTLMLIPSDALENAAYHFEAGEERDKVDTLLKLVEACNMKLPTINTDKTFTYYDFETDFTELNKYFILNPIENLYISHGLGRTRSKINTAKDWGYNAAHIDTINNILKHMGLMIGVNSERVQWRESGKMKEKAIHKFTLKFFADNLEPLILRDYSA
jgi:hypothetical protein